MLMFYIMMDEYIVSKWG